MRPSPKLLEAAGVALQRVMTFEHPADAVLSQFFRENKALGHRDRGLIAELIYAVLRRKRWLEHLIGNSGSAKSHPTPRQYLLATMMGLNGMSLRQMEDLLKPDEREWLARLKAEQSVPMTLAEQADMPDWLVERLSKRMNDGQILELARSLNQPAPLDLRVNPFKTDRDTVMRKLSEEGIENQPGTYSPLSIRLSTKPALARHPMFLGGEIEVQDEGSQLLAYLLSPKRGEMVVDFCAGAGGKTLLLGALMRSTGRLYAFDVSEKRLTRLRPRVARSGLTNVHPVCIASEHDARIKRLAGKIDRVLVDAPCSGLGTLRRNPDLKWRQTSEGVDELTRKQLDILNGASRLVKAGGRLVYATCSILDEENDQVVQHFLDAHPEFARVAIERVLSTHKIDQFAGDALRLAPQQHGTDGFFAVVMERRKERPAREKTAQADEESIGKRAAPSAADVVPADAADATDAIKSDSATDKS